MMKSAFAFSVLIAASLAHAESAHTIRATELHADSQSDAATLATLPENTTLEVLQRRGAWSEVKSGTQTGWVRMLNLRFDAKSGAAASSTSGNPLGGLNALLVSGRTSNSGTDTTGVRGMTEEDLNKAQPNIAEFQKMQKYASDKNVAQAFGKRSKLTVAKVPYLPDPGTADADSNSSRSGSN
jgi:hypothetical protein